MKELVSVIVPIYNVEKYLVGCIESIVNQTYDNLEIILVNDGSTDDCAKICAQYAQRDERIKVIHKENGGASDARNVGLSLAKGRYVSFVDSDDVIHKRFIEVLLSVALDKNADIVVGDFILLHEGEEYKDSVIGVEDICAAEVLSEKHLYNDTFIKTETVRFVVPWGKLCARKIFEGILFPVGKINEDTHTTYKLYERANRVVYLKKPLYYWRENLSSVTRRKFTIEQLSGLEAFMEQLEYYHKVGKQRHVEIVYDAYRNWFFWSYNEMQVAQIDYKKELKPYYEYMRNHVKYVKFTKSVGFYKWLKYRYLVYYKIPKLLE